MTYDITMIRQAESGNRTHGLWGLVNSAELMGVPDRNLDSEPVEV